MTGSGKTGLCVGLLEEAADRAPPSSSTQGRHHQPAAPVSRVAPGRFCAVGQRG
ncbi:MAG: hypothetical protein R2838_08595 [Caldilineaceae bacterium]